jgi:carboxyl-terminal processing protease
LTGDGLLLKAGRFDVSGMKPGETRDVAFTFDLLKTLKAEELTLEVSVADRDLGEFASEKLSIPVYGVRSVRKATPATAPVFTTSKKVEVFDQPEPGSGMVGFLPQGSRVAGLGTFGRFVQVALTDERYGFVRDEELEQATGTPPKKVDFTPELSHSAPLLDVTAKALATRGDSMRIDVVAKDSDGVLDVFVFVGNRKIFYKPNSSKNGKETRFSLEAKLNPGVNVITVVARESQDVATRHRVVVRKDGPNGEILPTPKNETFGEDWEFEEP